MIFFFFGGGSRYYTDALKESKSVITQEGCTYVYRRKNSKRKRREPCRSTPHVPPRVFFNSLLRTKKGRETMFLVEYTYILRFTSFDQEKMNARWSQFHIDARPAGLCRRIFPQVLDVGIPGFFWALLFWAIAPLVRVVDETILLRIYRIFDVST